MECQSVIVERRQRQLAEKRQLQAKEVNVKTTVTIKTSKEKAAEVKDSVGKAKETGGALDPKELQKAVQATVVAHVTTNLAGKINATSIVVAEPVVGDIVEVADAAPSTAGAVGACGGWGLLAGAGSLLLAAVL